MNSPTVELSGAAPGSRRAGANPTRRATDRSTLPWIVLAIGIPSSVLLFIVLSAAVENVARLRFERQASDAKGAIEVRIQFYANVLYGLKALYASDADVTRVEFHRFVNSLDLPRRYPGLDVLNFAAHVRGADKERFEEAVRRDTSLRSEGYPRFAVKPAGDRPEYHVIVYLEPMEGFEFAFGLDLSANPAVGGTDPNGLLALQHAARDSGNLTASGLPIHIKAKKDYTGLAMRLAVYRSGASVRTVDERRAAYLGSVGAGFNVRKLMEGAVEGEIARLIRFKLYDAGAASDAPGEALDVSGQPPVERLLFNSEDVTSRRARGAVAQDQLFTRSLPLEVGGRIWQIHFSALKSEMIELHDVLLPWAVLAGGIVSSVLLCAVLFSLASSRSRAVGMAIDMTRHLRESEASLIESRALLNDAQKLSHVGCCQYDPHRERLVWSEELYRIHGVDPKTFEPTYDSAMALVHPEDRSAWMDALAQALRSGVPFASEFRIVRPDGSVRDLRTLGEVIPDAAGTPSSLLWSVLDITEQKRNEDALRTSAEQLTALSRRLVEVQENERRQLSRELHDRVGQNLTALSINLDILRTGLPADSREEHRSRLSDSAALLESTVDSIENVMSELRPPMLDDYGLIAALDWYARDFARRTGIEVEVLGHDRIDRRAPPIEIALFRIAQEALTNVAKHAQATRVEIELEPGESHWTMTVSDNGIGMNGARAGGSRQRSGLGMVNMRERTQAVGGRFDVRSVPGGGTQIAIEVPVYGDTHTHRG